MFILGNILATIANILHVFISIYSLVIIVSALLSWVNPDPYNIIVRTLRSLTEPVYYRIHKWLPFTNVAGIDFSPIILLLALQLVDGAVVTSLYDIARRM